MANQASALATSLQKSGLVGNLGPSLKTIETSKIRIVEAVLQVIQSLDESKRESWRSIILGAGESGVSDVQLHRELGTSLSTLHRWRSDEAAPREGTRRLMKKAIVELVTERLAELGGGG